MLFRRILLAVLLAAAFAPAAEGAGVRIIARDVPLGASASAPRSLAPRTAPLPFDMVGLHWRGPGRVWFRTGSAEGRWTLWQPAAPEAEDQPDSGSAEAAAAVRWRLGNPYWTGSARRIQYRVAGTVTQLRAFFIASPVQRVADMAARAGAPAVIRRSQWGADESIVRAAPSFADRLRLAIVHHTAGSNSYTQAQSAAIVRGIQRYHVLSNGWNDIGYNFLVDKYGQVFEGRGGGIDQNVVGAHAKGFNTGSAGVAVLGTYTGTRISRVARRALVRLLAWRLDVGHVDPSSALDFVSYGNERFAAGASVRLRAVSGHRDTGSTSCPGKALYGQLDSIAASVAATGLPKLYEPEVAGSLGGPVRFTARLSAPAAWSVTVRNGVGTSVARGNGRGAAVDWSWDSSAAPYGRYTYEIAAGEDTRPAAGAVPAPPPLAIRRSRARPSVITPNGDRTGERMRIEFSLTRAAVVQVTVLASGALVKTLVPDRDLDAGKITTIWNGTRADGSPAPDRTYRIRIAATAGDQQVVRIVRVAVDRTLGSLAASPGVFSPNGDGRVDQIAFGFELARPADVRVHVLRGTTIVKRLFAAAVGAAGHQEVVWDGRLAEGSHAPSRVYRVRVQATTSLGTRVLERSFALDTIPPVLRVLSARTGAGVTRLRLVLSEPVRLRIWYGTNAWSDGDSISVERDAGEQVVSRRVRAGSIRVRAWDPAGNRSRAVIRRLG